MQHSTGYIVGFAAVVCVVCALFVAGSAVSLKDKQDENAVLDRQKKVLTVAGLMAEDEKISPDEVTRRFDENIVAKVVNLETGEVDETIQPAGFDQQKAMKDPEQSRKAPENAAKVQRIPNNALVYLVVGDSPDDPKTLILPIEGKGLWSTLYGYLALDSDSRTIKGITFYQHKETPGLGGEVDNPAWKKLWPGRKAFNERWQPKIQVKKGQAGPPDEDPYNVDGLSGATLTSRGVTNLLRFWLGDDGFGPYLAQYRSHHGV